MNSLYDWLIESNVQLMARRKTRGYVTIQKASDGERLIIQADEPNPFELPAFLAAQQELERNSRGESLVAALKILEPHTNGVFLVRPREESLVADCM